MKYLAIAAHLGSINRYLQPHGVPMFLGAQLRISRPLALGGGHIVVELRQGRRIHGAIGIELGPGDSWGDEQQRRLIEWLDAVEERISRIALGRLLEGLGRASLRQGRPS